MSGTKITFRSEVCSRFRKDHHPLECFISVCDSQEEPAHRSLSLRNRIGRLAVISAENIGLVPIPFHYLIRHIYVKILVFTELFS